MDTRFDRVYLLLLRSDDHNVEKMEALCSDYNISDNGVFKTATKWHFAWGIGPMGLIYLSPITFLNQKPDFKSIDELEDFLDKFMTEN